MTNKQWWIGLGISVSALAFLCVTHIALSRQKELNHLQWKQEMAEDMKQLPPGVVKIMFDYYLDENDERAAYEFFLFAKAPRRFGKTGEEILLESLILLCESNSEQMANSVALTSKLMNVSLIELRANHPKTKKFYTLNGKGDLNLDDVLHLGVGYYCPSQLSLFEQYK